MVSIDYGKLDWSMWLLFQDLCFWLPLEMEVPFFIRLFLSVPYNTDRLRGSQEKTKTYKKLTFNISDDVKKS